MTHPEDVIDPADITESTEEEPTAADPDLAFEAERESRAEEEAFLRQLAGGMGGPQHFSRNVKVNLPALDRAGPGPTVSVSMSGTDADLDITASIDAKGGTLSEKEYDACVSLIGEMI